MENPDRPGCAHTPCTCSAREGNSYCSEHCENASMAATHEEGCDCGHAECEQRSFQSRFTVA